MNKNKKILQLVLAIFVVLLLLSIVTTVYQIQWRPLKNINIIADIFPSKTSPEKAKQDSSFYVIKTAPHEGGDSTAKSFYHFFRKDRITSFYDDTDAVAMTRFIHKLYELKKQKKKIRIAFLGDSMLEEDFISSTLRKLLQQAFGGSGIGFVPIETVAEWTTATTQHSANWREENFRSNPKHDNLFLSGHVFYGADGAWFNAKDNTAAAAQTLSQRLFTGHGEACGITYNGTNKTIQPDSLFNNILLDDSAGNSLKLAVDNALLPVYGVSFESDEGIIVDNFSFRGSGGIEFAKMDTSFLKSIAENNPYDLIIMQYGINLIEKPTDTNFSWYYKPMKASVTRLQQCFPNADILIVSTADRAFRYDGGMQTAVGIKNIIAMQEKIAYETGSSFYNMFSSMGGDGSMVKWVEGTPVLAYRDYMHPNAAGSEILGQSIFDAMMNEYKKIKE